MAHLFHNDVYLITHFILAHLFNNFAFISEWYIYFNFLYSFSQHTWVWTYSVIDKAFTIDRLDLYWEYVHLNMCKASQVASAIRFSVLAFNTIWTLKREKPHFLQWNRKVERLLWHTVSIVVVFPYREPECDSAGLGHWRTNDWRKHAG